jgi:NAD(P)-dependent dehydrogenase (short-subunit alcohol dehydrogenase family)
MSELPPPPQSTDIFRPDFFDEQVVLITGSGTGIGKHLALVFADLGADVAVASRNSDHLTPVVDMIEERFRRASY